MACLSRLAPLNEGVIEQLCQAGDRLPGLGRNLTGIDGALNLVDVGLHETRCPRRELRLIRHEGDEVLGGDFRHVGVAERC